MNDVSHKCTYLQIEGSININDHSVIFFWETV